MSRRFRPSLVHVDDERQRAAGFEDVVHGFGDAFTVGPVERLPEGHEPEGAQVEGGDVLRDRSDPSDVFGSPRRVSRISMGTTPAPAGTMIWRHTLL